LNEEPLPARRVTHWLRQVTVAIIISVLVWFVMIMILEDQMIYFPAKYPEGYWEPEEYGVAVEDCYFDTEDGVRLHGWFCASEAARLTLLWCHGNAGNISHRLDIIKNLHALGINIFIFDYRGYGKSEGEPDEEGIYRDGVAAYEYLVKKREIHPDSIVLFGESLGTAVAVDLAVKRNIRALVLQSAFTNAKDMAVRMFPIPVPPFIIHSKFDSIDKIRQVRVPVFFIHGDDDTIVPVELGRKLFDAANEPKEFYQIAGADHNDTHLVAGKEYYRRIGAFLAEL